MEMSENYGRTELEAIIKNHQLQRDHRFLSSTSCAPPLTVDDGLPLAEMVLQNPFRFDGFFQVGAFLTSPHNPGTAADAIREEPEVAAGHQDIKCGFYPSRTEFCSNGVVTTSIAARVGNLGDDGLVFSVHGERMGNPTSSDSNVRQWCASSSPSGKMEEIQGGGDGGSSRWPRHETLTLLELRAKLDSKFREATQKGPLWEDVSREMAEGYGYNRSGKKCREKFENLCKYYKKTKEGRTGRQDGKNYRFYAQLEALCCGDEGKAKKNTSTKITEGFDVELLKGGVQVKKTKACDQKFLQYSPEFVVPATSSSASEEEGQLGNIEDKTNGDRKKWKKKLKSNMERLMKRFMDRQEEWFEKILKTLERQEQERIAREEAWRREETGRLQQEHEFWAKERAWAEARDTKLMESLRKMIGEECTTNASSSPPTQFDTQELERNHCTESTISGGNYTGWSKREILSLVRLKMSMEVRFDPQTDCSGSNGNVWEEISVKMLQLGFDKSGQSCKEKWDTINHCFKKSKDPFNKKRKDDSQAIGGDYMQQYIEAFCDHNVEMDGSHELSLEGDVGTLRKASSEGICRH